jgi:SAM-dependent methyltransferase
MADTTVNSIPTYHFHTLKTCPMCHALPDQHRVLGKRMNRSQGKKPWKLRGLSVSVVQCKECGLISADPQPVPLNIQDHYGVPPETYWKESYFEVRPDYFSGEIARLQKLQPFVQGMKALDIGAGIGKCMIAMKNAGYEVYGCEPSVPFHERAVTRMGIAPDRLQCAVMEEAVYPESHFDFITFGVVLEHLIDPALAIERAMKWLKPGGIIHIEVPSSRWLIHRLVNGYYRLRGSDYVANLSPMHEPFHLYEFDLLSFRSHARRIGYEIADVEYYVCDTYLPGWMDPFLRAFMRRSNTGMQLCVWLRKP